METLSSVRFVNISDVPTTLRSDVPRTLRKGLLLNLLIAFGVDFTKIKILDCGPRSGKCPQRYKKDRGRQKTRAGTNASIQE